MESVNIFVIMGAVVMFLYCLLVFVFFVGTIGFGTIPLLVISSVGFFAVVISVAYVNYDPNSDYTSSDNVYLISMTVIVIVAYILLLFAVFFIYTQYGKPTDPDFEGLETSHLEDRDVNNPVASPFSMNHK